MDVFFHVIEIYLLKKKIVTFLLFNFVYNLEQSVFYVLMYSNTDFRRRRRP